VSQTRTPEADGPAGEDEPSPVAHRVLREIISANALIPVLAVLLALIFGAILIVATDPQVQSSATYFFGRPGDVFQAAWEAVAGAYTALFQGAVFDPRRGDLLSAIKPLTDTLVFATPLVAGGLGVAVAFRAGMFNIGGKGQMLIAAAIAGWIGASLDLPWGIHLIMVVAAGMLGGAAWAGIAGLLKARTGAHEVIVTIMLNYIAFYLLSWLIRTPGLLQAPGSGNPKSAPMADTAVFPNIFGAPFGLHWGFPIVILATAAVWWLIERSSFGFRLRAVGLNSHAAQFAGIDVPRTYITVMLTAGSLLGLAGVMQVSGTVTTGFTAGIDAGIGFDAITVALLGRSRPWGVFAAGVLFGAFKAGGFSMQAAEGVPIEIILVVQSLTVLFLAAPPLVRTIFRLPKRG
jgi:general nucleoside transport system permease protein